MIRSADQLEGGTLHRSTGVEQDLDLCFIRFQTVRVEGVILGISNKDSQIKEPLCNCRDPPYCSTAGDCYGIKLLGRDFANTDESSCKVFRRRAPPAIWRCPKIIDVCGQSLNVWINPSANTGNFVVAKIPEQARINESHSLVAGVSAPGGLCNRTTLCMTSAAISS